MNAAGAETSGPLEIKLPADCPNYLRFSEKDAPVPNWEQVTQGSKAGGAGMIEHFSRIVSGTNDPVAAQDIWDTWPGNYRRSVALIITAIYSEGWLDSVGPINGSPWDGGLYFEPLNARNTIEQVLDSKSGKDGEYTQLDARGGLFAYLNSWNHKGWNRGWMENDAAMAALHVGIFRNGIAEVHFDAFNPHYTNGAPRSELVRIPMVGEFNYKLFRLHRRWEHSGYAGIVRTSANFYHMLKERLPLSF